MYKITWLTLFSGSLAVYRLAKLIAIDIGPMEIFDNFRLWLGRKASYEQRRLSGKLGPWQSLAEGVSCPHCVGVWLAFFVGVLLYINQPITNAFINILALAGLQSFLQELSHDAE